MNGRDEGDSIEALRRNVKERYLHLRALDDTITELREQTASQHRWPEHLVRSARREERRVRLAHALDRRQQMCVELSLVETEIELLLLRRWLLDRIHTPLLPRCEGCYRYGRRTRVGNLDHESYPRPRLWPVRQDSLTVADKALLPWPLRRVESSIHGRSSDGPILRRGPERGLIITAALRRQRSLTSLVKKLKPAQSNRSSLSLLATE